jgi:16S rRNA processing protein RimM
VKPLLEVGYVRAAHGLNGEVAVKTYDPASDVLAEVERLWARTRNSGERELRIEAVRDAPKGDLLVRFEGVDSREQAQELVGAALSVFREDLSAPSEGEFFQGDLVGLTALDADGNVLGTVEEIWNSGPVPNLVIRGKSGELMVPFADDFVKDVSMERKTVTVIPPQWE